MSVTLILVAILSTCLARAEHSHHIYKRSYTGSYGGYGMGYSGLEYGGRMSYYSGGEMPGQYRSVSGYGKPSGVMISCQPHVNNIQQQAYNPAPPPQPYYGMQASPPSLMNSNIDRPSDGNAPAPSQLPVEPAYLGKPQPIVPYDNSNQTQPPKHLTDAYGPAKPAATPSQQQYDVPQLQYGGAPPPQQYVPQQEYDVVPPLQQQYGRPLLPQWMYGGQRPPQQQYGGLPPPPLPQTYVALPPPSQVMYDAPPPLPQQMYGGPQQQYGGLPAQQQYHRPVLPPQQQYGESQQQQFSGPLPQQQYNVPPPQQQQYGVQPQHKPYPTRYDLLPQTQNQERPQSSYGGQNTMNSTAAQYGMKLENKGIDVRKWKNEARESDKEMKNMNDDSEKQREVMNEEKMDKQNQELQ